MTSYYDLLDELNTLYIADENVKQVSKGSLDDIADNKQTMYSLAHILVNSATTVNSVVQFNMTVFVMDVVNISKAEVTDKFKGNDNEDDVLNTTLATQVRVLEQLRRGDVTVDSEVRLLGNPTLEPFTDRFQYAGNVAGWAATFDLEITHSMTRCD